MDPELRTHTLLRISVLGRPVLGVKQGGGPCGPCLIPDTGTAAPDWVCEALAQAPWVVIRRARSVSGLIPVGVRGRLRRQRWAAWLAADRILERVTPQELSDRHAWRSAPRRDSIGALQALEAVARIMTAHGLERLWGPAGSVGFELASGSPAAHPRSDLDLCVQLPMPPSLALARSLQGQLAAVPVRTDVLLETSAGGLALADYAQGAGSCVLRTPEGPRLCATAGAQPPPAGFVTRDGTA